MTNERGESISSCRLVVSAKSLLVVESLKSLRNSQIASTIDFQKPIVKLKSSIEVVKEL